MSKKKNKRLDADKFLFKTETGSIVETELFVTKLPADVSIDNKVANCLGTIEARVYVLRRFGDEHALQDKDPYYSVVGEAHNPDGDVGCEIIAPEFTITYTKDASAHEHGVAARIKRKMNSKRPGHEPWAIFRFHYRSIGIYLLYPQC